ncbi:hypothetical protein [Fodinicola feengrottensis]|uniref:hypothetical protein n=1 Tax=Fodinicola feengrottensis TaxID=435914 RepID=UPI0013D7B72D|nr:hypothetical protein [Fodinicola feengrottensis]
MRQLFTGMSWYGVFRGCPRLAARALRRRALMVLAAGLALLLAATLPVSWDPPGPPPPRPRRRCRRYRTRIGGSRPARWPRTQLHRRQRETLSLSLGR